MQRNVPVTVTAARMLVLLPETPMDIRYANQKVNTAFLVRKQYVDEMSPLKSTHLFKVTSSFSGLSATTGAYK